MSDDNQGPAGEQQPLTAFSPSSTEETGDEPDTRSADAEENRENSVNAESIEASGEETPVDEDQSHEEAADEQRQTDNADESDTTPTSDDAAANTASEETTASEPSPSATPDEPEADGGPEADAEDSGSPEGEPNEETDVDEDNEDEREDESNDGDPPGNAGSASVSEPSGGYSDAFYDEFTGDDDGTETDDPEEPLAENEVGGPDEAGESEAGSEDTLSETHSEESSPARGIEQDRETADVIGLFNDVTGIQSGREGDRGSEPCSDHPSESDDTDHPLPDSHPAVPSPCLRPTNPRGVPRSVLHTPSHRGASRTRHPLSDSEPEVDLEDTDSAVDDSPEVEQERTEQSSGTAEIETITTSGRETGTVSEAGNVFEESQTDLRYSGTPAATTEWEPEDPTYVEQAAEYITTFIEWLEASDETSAIDEYAYRTFSGYFRDHEERFDHIQKAVNQARMDETWDFYLARASFLTLLCSGLAGFGFMFLTALLYLNGISLFSASIAFPSPVAGVASALRLPTAFLFAFILGCGLIGVPTGWIFYKVPEYRATRRGVQINMLLPQAVTYIYALSQGSLTVPTIVRQLAQRTDTYGPVAEEFEAVVNNMDYLGTDLRTALHRTRDATPSEDLSELLSDLSSIVNSGSGATEFMERKTEEYQRQAEIQKERHLEKIDVVGQFYVIAGVLFMLLLVTVLVIYSAMTQSGLGFLQLVVYLVIPLVSLMFVVYLDTTGKDEQATKSTLERGETPLTAEEVAERLREDQGDENRPEYVAATDGGGHTTNPVTISRTAGKQGSLSPVERAALQDLYSALRSRRVLKLLREPARAIKRQPLYSLVLTIPITGLYLLFTTYSGISVPSPAQFTTTPVWTTTVSVILPLAFMLGPIAALHERNARRQDHINEQLPEALRKLASAARTRDTLAGAIQTVAESADHYLATEFERVHNELDGWNVSLASALTRMANRVENPRLTRVVNLLIEANTASGRVHEVLEVAARDVETEHKIDVDRRTRVRRYMYITVGGNLLFLLICVVMVVMLLPTLSEATQAASSATGGTPTGGTASMFGGAFSVGRFKMVFFHAALVQALCSGFVAGKLGWDDTISGIKISLAQMLLVTGVFWFI